MKELTRQVNQWRLSTAAAATAASVVGAFRWRLAWKRLNDNFMRDGRRGLFNYSPEGNVRWMRYIRRMRWLSNVRYGMKFTANRHFDKDFMKREQMLEKGV